MDKIQKAIEVCKKVHANQIYEIGGKKVPYYNHCFIVADIIKNYGEDTLDKDFAMTVAYLHDTLEDTPLTREYIKENFGEKVMYGVDSLTKPKSGISPNQRLDESLDKIISRNNREVAAVKLADRICNLMEIPQKWSKAKCEQYLDEAHKIDLVLGSASPALSKMLRESIEKYKIKIKEHGEDMRYYTLKELLYSYDRDTGFTLKFDGDKWKLSDLSYAALVEDRDVQEITKSEAVKICGEKSPEDFIDEFISGALGRE